MTTRDMPDIPDIPGSPMAPTPPVPPVLTRLSETVQRAAGLAARGTRTVLGIAGGPGSGKSTIAAAIVTALGPGAAVVVPMDGFHLANTQLRAQGLAEVKGNIATFDADGYAALLARLRDQRRDEIVYAPYFDRSLEESIGSAIRVDPTVPLVITEGNYLLSDGPSWERARACLTECWYVDVAVDLRVHRLIERHIGHGRSPQAAREWVLRSDEANARLVAATADRADVVVRLSEQQEPDERAEP